MNNSTKASLRMFALVAALSGSALNFGSASSAFAEQTPVVSFSQSEEQQIRDLLTKFEVPAEAQNALVDKAVAGVPWDVNVPGASPVSTEETVIGGFDYTIKRYSDGSVSAAGLEVPVEAPPGGIQAKSIIRCTYTSGSGYSNASGCQVDGVWGPVIIGATDVAYTLVDGGPDQITNAGVPFQNCLPPVSCSTPALVVSDLTEGTGPAQIRWQADVSTLYGGSWNTWVHLNVGHDSATEITS